MYVPIRLVEMTVAVSRTREISSANVNKDGKEKRVKSVSTTIIIIIIIIIIINPAN